MDGCLTSQQHASVSQGRICSDKFTCCYTETQVADQTFYLTQSQYTDTGPTGSSADPITPGAWQGNHWSATFLSHWYDSTRKSPVVNGIRTPGSSALEADALATRPTARSDLAQGRFLSPLGFVYFCFFSVHTVIATVPSDRLKLINMHKQTAVWTSPVDNFKYL